MGKWVDYYDSYFGRLHVISHRIRKNNQTYYLCECECGNQKEIRIDHLKSGAIQSCGCLQKETMRKIRGRDLSNQTFGYLTAISINEEETKRHFHGDLFWNCQCKCGNKTVVAAGQLISKKTQSCGCYNKERIRDAHSIDMSGEIYNYLKILSLNEEVTAEKKHAYWNCKCLLCGKDCIKNGSLIRNGNVKSCGCLKSSYEKEIEKILIQNDISYIKEYSFSDLRGKKHPLRFDFAIFKDDKLCYLIEYQGEQHFHSVKYYGGEEDFKNRQWRDYLKKEYCKKNNIPLIIIKGQVTDKDIIKEELL